MTKLRKSFRHERIGLPNERSFYFRTKVVNDFVANAPYICHHNNAIWCVYNVPKCFVWCMCNICAICSKTLTAGSKLVIGLFLRVFYILNAIVIHVVIKLYNNLSWYKDPNYLFIICLLYVCSFICCYRYRLDIYK